MALAEAGADIIIVSRNEEKNKEVVNEIKKLGRKALSFSIDLRKISDIQDTVSQIVENIEDIDILVNNAGVSHTNYALNVNEEEWDMVLDLNVKSLFFCCQAVAKRMNVKGSGKIINVSSVAGAVGELGISSYTASKAAVSNLTKSLALEWARYKV